MSLGSTSEHLANLRYDANLLIERAGDQESQAEALAAAAEGDCLHADAASHAATHLTVDEVRYLLTAQLERSTARAVAARNLLTAAHQQHAAAGRLLVDLDAVRTSREAPRANAVLVVDDHSDIRDVLARVLEKAGFVVRTAVNGLEGLIAAYEMRPAVILMDVSMPVLDGIEATRLIKATPATRDTRVIAYTGNPSFDDTPTAALFAAVIQKPATADTVLATVQRFACMSA